MRLQRVIENLHLASERQTSINRHKAGIRLASYVHLGIGVGLVSILNTNVAHSFMDDFDLVLNINMHKLIALASTSNHDRCHLKQIMRPRIDIHTELKLLVKCVMRDFHINYFLTQFVRHLTTFGGYWKTKRVLDTGRRWAEDYCVGDTVGTVG